MKFLVLFAGFIALSAGEEVPSISGNNSHYVEGKSRYIWMPDGKGVPHLVDLQVSNDTVAQDAIRKGANNHYWLFTRLNPSNHQILVHGNANSIYGSFYSGNRPTVVIVHGWNSDGNSAINPLLTSAFLAAQDCNVIVVDYSSVASLLYPISSAAVPSVGEYLGNFIIWLVNVTGSNLNNFHLVGFSLGAHVVGVAGRTADGRAARVTGLDPIGPLWRDNNHALNHLSGQYVEVIHTGGVVLGIFKPSGHADFYVNGGRHPQPGCVSHICSHNRAYEFFATTIHRNNLVGCACTWNQADAVCSGDTLHMGNAILSKKGIGAFCLTTPS